MYIQTILGGFITCPATLTARSVLTLKSGHFNASTFKMQGKSVFGSRVIFRFVCNMFRKYLLIQSIICFLYLAQKQNSSQITTTKPSGNFSPQMTTKKAVGNVSTLVTTPMTYAKVTSPAATTKISGKDTITVTTTKGSENENTAEVTTAEVPGDPRSSSTSAPGIKGKRNSKYLGFHPKINKYINLYPKEIVPKSQPLNTLRRWVERGIAYQRKVKWDPCISRGCCSSCQGLLETLINLANRNSCDPQFGREPTLTYRL